MHSGQPWRALAFGAGRSHRRGSLIIVSTVVPGLVCAFRFADDGAAEPLAEGAVAEALAGASGWIWLHLNLADWRCRRWLQDHAGAGAEATVQFADPPTRQSIAEVGDVLVGHLADFRREFDRNSTDFAWLHALLLPRCLITGRVKAVQSVERLRGILNHGARIVDPGALLSRLVACYPDALDAALHRLTDELELIEDHVLDDRHRGERRRLMLMRREAAQLHRHMRSLRRALGTADRSIDRLPPGLAATAQRLVALDQDFEAMEARARFFHDEIDAKLAAETNRQLYTLSALTAAFLPPALVAGLFGMNLEGMPFAGADWGFWGAAGLSLMSSGAVVLYLRARTRTK